MKTSPTYPSSVIDLAESWHRVAGAQHELSHSEAAARDSVPIEPLRHEHTDAFDIAVETGPETVTVRVTPHVGRAERLHIWATSDLLVARIEVNEPIEHLVRLPAAVNPEEARVEIYGGSLVATFARRSDMPVVVWPN